MCGLLPTSEIAQGICGGVSVPLGTGEGCRHIKIAMDPHKGTHGHYQCVPVSPVALSEVRCSVSRNEGVSVLTLPKIPLSQLVSDHCPC